MSLLSLVILLVLVGVGLFLLNKYVPMDGKVKTLLNIVVIVAMVLYSLYAFGILGHGSSMSSMPVPQVQ